MDNRSVQATSYNHWDTLSDKDSVSLQVSTRQSVFSLRCVVNQPLCQSLTSS
jgi:hypothetical protein